MATSAILKKKIFVKSFGTKLFFMFLGSENTILALFFGFEFKYSLSGQIKDIFLFFDVKIGIFLKSTVKRTQFITVYQKFYYNMFVYGHIFLKKYRMLRLNNSEHKYDSSE